MAAIGTVDGRRWTGVGSALIVLSIAVSGPCRAEPVYTNSELCPKVESALSGARKFFAAAAKTAYSDITSTAKPRQADLYILVHYLMDHRRLAFGPGGEEEKQLTENIIGYFLSTFDAGLWRTEGCLLIKLLIGLRSNNVPYEKIEPLEKFYADLIEENWQSQSVGECISDQIDRTYIVGAAADCKNASDELEAKVGYYVATSEPGSPNLLAKVKLPFLGDYSERFLLGWWSIIPEVWIAMTFRDQKTALVSKDRLDNTAQNFDDSVAKALSAKPPQMEDADQLLFGRLLVHRAFLKSDKLLLEALLKQQLKDGGFPAKIGKTPSGHNTRATPTHFAIQALNETKETLCGRKRQEKEK